MLYVSQYVHDSIKKIIQWYSVKISLYVKLDWCNILKFKVFFLHSDIGIQNFTFLCNVVHDLKKFKLQCALAVNWFKQSDFCQNVLGKFVQSVQVLNPGVLAHKYKVCITTHYCIKELTSWQVPLPHFYSTNPQVAI